MQNNSLANTIEVVPQAYEPPTIKVMSDDEVLRAFQMTAAQIGAAATWWVASCIAC